MVFCDPREEPRISIPERIPEAPVEFFPGPHPAWNRRLVCIPLLRIFALQDDYFRRFHREKSAPGNALWNALRGQCCPYSR